jgi:hypothetical protein
MPLSDDYAQRRQLQKRLAEQSDQWAGIPEPLLDWIWNEKQRLVLLPATRMVVDEQGQPEGGYTYSLDHTVDAYYPGHLDLFSLKGYWIPVERGTLLQLDDTADSPLLRDGPEGKEILFLVHPKSERLFQDVIREYADCSVAVTALALSSFRTLLVRLPCGTFVMAKVSLDDTVSGKLRHVTTKECGCSVGMTWLMRQKAPIAFLEDSIAFIPSCGIDAGMIIRSIPKMVLEPMSQGIHMIPFFALFAKRNRSLLDALIATSSLTPTEWIRIQLLEPLAEIFASCIFDHNISIEAHAQNLLLVVDTNLVSINFIYRDMGGVNGKLTRDELKAMPAQLQNLDYYYLDTHEQDTARALEFFATSILFNLTKTLFKSDTYDKIDPPLAAWKQEMIKGGFAGNWTVLGESSDHHEEQLTPTTFQRYGYVERMFALEFLAAMRRRGIFRHLAGSQEEVAYRHFEEQIDIDTREWFFNLIMQVYPYHLSRKEALNQIVSTQQCIEECLTKANASLRPMTAQSPDLFEKRIQQIENIIELGYSAFWSNQDPYANAWEIQLYNRLRHTHLTFEEPHALYPHAPIAQGPFLYGATTEALRSGQIFLRGMTEDCPAIEFCVDSSLEELKKRHATWIRSIIADPLTSYHQFRARLELHGVEAPFPEFADVIDALILSLQDPELISDTASYPLFTSIRHNTLAELWYIKQKNYPYLSLIYAIECALVCLDAYARGKSRDEAPPELFHSTQYQYYSAYLKSELPSHFILPTIHNLGATDLLKVRGVPIGFLGVNVEEVWVDGFLQTPYEFWCHDVNHTRRMWQFFKLQMQKRSLTLDDAVVQAHQFVSKELVPLVAIDKCDSFEVLNQKRMIKIILFELLHEDAYAPDREVIGEALMAPLGSPTAVQTIHRYHVEYTVEKAAIKLALIHWKLVADFFDQIDDRNDAILAKECRSEDHVWRAACCLISHLRIEDIVNHNTIFNYIYAERQYTPST